MASQTISFITWNVNGLKTNIDKICEEIKKYDVVFLQETRSNNKGDFTHLNEDFWVLNTVFSSRKKGAAILVKKKRLNFEYDQCQIDDCGAYVVLKCSLKGQRYTLVSVYNHRDDRKTLDKLSELLQSMTTGQLVIGGDFNTVLNPLIDKVILKEFTDDSVHKTLRSHLENLMNSLQLVDVWRRKNPVDQHYTYHKNLSKSRLDYFFIPEECVWRVKSCEIKESEMPDHSPVYLYLSPVVQSQAELDQQPIALLDDKIAALKEKCPSQDEESRHGLSKDVIRSAIQSLQVSDTPRPDNIPVSVYKHQLKNAIPYIKMLYDRIYRGTFKCSENEFNKTEKSRIDDSQSFFNVDYLIIATILAKRLDDFSPKKSNRCKHKNPAFVINTSKTFSMVSLSYIEKQDPNLSEDFKILHNLLRDAPTNKKSPSGEKQLHQSCPLTPVLKTLALKCIASTLNCNDILVYKESISLSVQPEEIKNVEAAVKDRFKEECEMKELTRETVPGDGSEELQPQGEQEKFFLRTSKDVSKCNDKLVKVAEGPEAYSKQLVAYLSKPVELSLDYVVGKVMDRLFAKGSLSDWTDVSKKTGKDAFSKMEISQKIIDAVEIILSNENRETIEKEVQKQLKNYTHKPKRKPVLKLFTFSNCSLLFSSRGQPNLTNQTD